MLSRHRVTIWTSCYVNAPLFVVVDLGINSDITLNRCRFEFAVARASFVSLRPSVTHRLTALLWGAFMRRL